MNEDGITFSRNEVNLAPRAEAGKKAVVLTAGIAAWTVLVLAAAPLAGITFLFNQNFNVWLALASVCAVFLAYGGIIVDWFDRNYRRSPLALEICAGAGLAGLVFFVLSSLDWDIVILVMLLSGGILPPLLAPFVALRVRRTQARVWPLVVLWVVPSFVPAFFNALRALMGLRVIHGLAIPFLVLAGPWATQAVRIVDFPNAGEFFSLPLALGLTALLALAIGLYIKRPQWRPRLIIPYAAVLGVWHLIGWGQLLNCMT